MLEEFNEPYIRLDLSYSENTQTTDIRVERSIKGEEAQFLNRVLAEFKYFLQSVGFTYVENIVAVDTEGDEISSSDLF